MNGEDPNERTSSSKLHLDELGLIGPYLPRFNLDCQTKTYHYEINEVEEKNESEVHICRTSNFREIRRLRHPSLQTGPVVYFYNCLH